MKIFELNYIRFLQGISLILLLFRESSSQSRRIDPVIEKQINDYITQVYLPKSQVSTLGLAIVQNDGELLFTTGYGLADREKGIPITNDTQFGVGSITKGFTAVALVKALHEMFPGRPDVLDVPIRKLIPQANFTLIDRFRSENANVRDLLAHRMCVAGMNVDIPQVAEAIPTFEEMIYRQRYHSEICPMRSRLRYSNNMISAGGHLLSILRNKTYEEAVKDFMDEVGMTNSAMVSKEDDYSKLPLRARPYYVKDGITHPFNTDLLKRVAISNPSGGWFTTPNDMVKFLRLHLNLGKIDGKELLPEEAMRQVRTPVMIFGEGSIYGYGLGLIVGQFEGDAFYLHDGIHPSYSSQIVFYPRENLGIFITANESPVRAKQLELTIVLREIIKGSMNPTNILPRFMKSLHLNEDFSRTSSNVQKELQAFLSRAKEMESGKKQKAEEIVGKYGSGVGGELEIIEKFDDAKNETGLFLQYGKWLHGWMDHVEGATYKIRLVTDLIQDSYALGLPESVEHVVVANDSLFFFYVLGQSELFFKDLSLDKSRYE